MARVGFVAELSGTAWSFDPGARVWAPLQRNQAIGQGDQLRTAPLSYMTVHVDSSTLWLDAQTELKVLQMDDVALTLRLLAGDVALRLRDAGAAQATRVQTREGVVSHPTVGLVSIAQGNRATGVGVLQGSAQFDSDPGAPLQRAWLHEGEQAEFVWDDSARMERQALRQDTFSAWFVYRDQVESGLVPTRAEAYYAPPEMARPEELQRYENQRATVVEYGRGWIPKPPVRVWESHRGEVVPRPNNERSVPAFNRDGALHAPGQHQRPIVPATPATPMPSAMPTPRDALPSAQAAPRQPHPVEGEKHDNARHSKRDNQDRELRKPGLNSQR
jgi:hypothetical protein